MQTWHYPLSIAPMMERTDRHFRYFLRQISRRVMLYTEMVTAQAIVHGDLDRLIGFSVDEKPLVLQVGGDDPLRLAHCARLAESWGYDAINLNVGCPSNRVQSGNFGACLMLQPDRVAEAVAAMVGATAIPVSVKHRIGVDERDRYDDMVEFVETVTAAGCHHFTVHARKAWLQGLDPKENRTIPPLRYGDVYRLKQDFPELFIEINGGILTLDQAQAQLAQVDAVMIGRAAYDDPYLLAAADAQIYGDDAPIADRCQVARAMIPYIEQATRSGTRLHSITRHMLQLFANQPGSRRWKRYLTEQSCKPGAGAEVIEGALDELDRPM
jgi:tRNA-dihydrouridine synthase A